MSQKSDANYKLALLQLNVSELIIITATLIASYIKVNVANFDKIRSSFWNISS